MVHSATDHGSVGSQLSDIPTGRRNPKNPIRIPNKTYGDEL
jgi:hypothetical protein